MLPEQEIGFGLIFYNGFWSGFFRLYGNGQGKQEEKNRRKDIFHAAILPRSGWLAILMRKDTQKMSTNSSNIKD